MAKKNKVRARKTSVEPSSGGDLSTRFEIATGAIGLTLVVAIYVLRLDRVVGLLSDDGWYTLLAKALATGQGYQLINSPSPGILPVYPPVYPFLLSLAYRILPSFPRNVMLLKSVSVLAMLGAGGASYQHFRRDREWPHLLSLLCAVTVALTPALVFLATSSMMSECAFTCLQLLAVLMIGASARAEDGNRQLWNAALGGTLAGLAFLTRSIGLAVIGAGFIYLLKSRRWKAAAVFTALVVVVSGPWMIYSRSHQPTEQQRADHGGGIVQDYSVQFWQVTAGDSSSGTISINGLPARMWANATHIAANNMAMIFAPVFYRSPKISGEETLEKGTDPYDLSYVLSLAMLFGFVVAVRRQIGPGELVTMFTLLTAVMWPFNTFRYLLPLMPFLLYYLIESVRGISDSVRQAFGSKTARQSWLAGTIAACLILAIYIDDHAMYLVKRSDSSRAEYLPWGTLFEENEEALKWIREKTPDDAVFASINPALIYLYTGRKAIASDKPAENWENWKRLKVRYLAFLAAYPVPGPGRSDGRFVQAYQSKGPLKLRIVDLGDPDNRLPWNP